MKKIKARLINSLLLGAMICDVAHAAPYTQDAGKIKTFYANASGGFALQLDVGFPNAQAGGQCTTNNGWAGNSTADPILKSTLLAAKASQQTVNVTIQGCDGSWYKIIDVYVN